MLVVYFEEPGVYEEVMSDQAGKTQLELLLIVDIISRYRGWNISLLENTFGSTLCAIQISLLWLSTQNWYCKLYGQLHIIVINYSGNDVRLFAFDELLHFF